MSYLVTTCTCKKLHVYLHENDEFNMRNVLKFDNVST